MREPTRTDGDRGLLLEPAQRRLGERGARGAVPGGRRRQPGVHHGHHLGVAEVDRDDVELALARAQLDRAPEAGLLLRLQQAAGLDLARELAGVHAARLERRSVDGEPEALRRRQHPLGVDVEPAVDGLAQEVAADEQDQERWSDRHQQEHEQQLHAQPRAEDPPPPLHQHADEVSAQDEDEHEQQREVDDRQAVEERRGQEVRLEVAALAEQQVGEQEEDEQPAGHPQHEPEVVLEPLPSHSASVAPQPHLTET